MRGTQVFSTITKDGALKLELRDVDIATPKPHEVVVEIDAAPINPSDMWVLFGPAGMKGASYDAASRCLTAPIAPQFLGGAAARLGKTISVGNEGAGKVVAAGDAPEAQALLGKTVAILTRACYAQYNVVAASDCLVHRDDTTSIEAASSFVNPLTVLTFLETMKRENHTALVHSAAASNLGQMLVRLCQKDKVPLVNIVRKAEQKDLLQKLGADHIVNTSDADYMAQLEASIEATGAMMGFDATGGGQLASDMLTAMERVAIKDPANLDAYGSIIHKQVYLYGNLELTPTTLNRAYGMNWSIGGWLLMIQLGKYGADCAASLRQRVADEIKTTFASSYTAELSLTDMLQPEIIAAYLPKHTGEKFLVRPQRG
jgi:NADPH:quinone reductase-like Zn-dependent oxidoreductase